MYHQPVLVKQIIESLPPRTNTIIDGTFGHGWHSLAILADYPWVNIIGIDRDIAMIKKAESRMWSQKNITLWHWSYADILDLCKKNNITDVDYILLDIWVNMDHYKQPDRWFSVHEEAKLDMRFDTNQSMTASIFINTATLDQLQQAFIQYADFTLPKAHELAQAIVIARKQNHIQTTTELRTILWSCGLGKNASIVIFQAIRIVVNQELQQLEKFLAIFDGILAIGGRCAIISYHSIEDRIVKQSFKNKVANGSYISIHKKAIKPSWQEIKQNKASRSAVLRIIEKKQ